MRIFGGERESLRIKRFKAARAVYVNQDVQEVEINLITDDGERLDLQINARAVPELIGQLTDAYEAINPPLNRRRMGQTQAGWYGMDNN